MSDLFAVLIALVILAIPELLVVMLIRALRKKPIKKLKKALLICVGSILPLAILCGVTSPDIRCEHEYEITKEITPTCIDDGEIHRYCPLCESEDIEYIEALGHSMKEVSRTEPTSKTEGKLVSRCKRCDYEETQTLDKLKPDKDDIEQNTSEGTDVIDTNWKTVFLANGFTENEISKYNEILNNVGVTDYHDVEVIENGIMHIIRGKIFDSDVLQLNITLEKREIIYIELAGIPAEKTETYINWRGKIKFKTVGTKKSVDLYYDTEGGYIAKLDWENKTVVPFEE